MLFRSHSAFLLSVTDLGGAVIASHAPPRVAAWGGRVSESKKPRCGVWDEAIRPKQGEMKQIRDLRAFRLSGFAQIVSIKIILI